MRAGEVLVLSHFVITLLPIVTLVLPYVIQRSGPLTCCFLAAVHGASFVGEATANSQPNLPEWTGKGRYRLLVEIPAMTDLDRADEQVAAFEFRPSGWLGPLANSHSVDINSLQVHQYDPNTGAVASNRSFEGRLSPDDLPCRYEDDRYRKPFTSRVGRASETLDGRPALAPRERKDRLFNRRHDNRSGRLVWSYCQQPKVPAYFAIYFDLLPQTSIRSVPAAPWIGDGAPLRQAMGQPIGGFSHFTAGVGDLNGDGLFDVVAGTEKGDMIWFANEGTRDEPIFLGCELLEDEEGQIDTGWYAAPVVCDWNDDGLQDLLVGTSGNVILWWQNVGTKGEPKFEYRGFIAADGKQRLEVPESPVAEDQHGIFARDYFNQPWIGDLNGDGILDLVTGGYTTGQIFWYRGTARNSDGTPKLEYAGTLNANGEPIDTIWAAAPAIADFDGDGKLDLVTGAWWWSGIHRQPQAGETDLLWYYRGVDQDDPTKYVREPLPLEGKLPAGSIARPSVIDANHDGLLDLFVSESGGNAYLLLNRGTKSAPRWDANVPAFTVPWGFTREFDVAAPTADIDGDGSLESLVGNQLFKVGGSPATPELKLLGIIHVNGTPIAHPGPGYGDPYYFSILHDWDGDGLVDVLWGTQQGAVFFHRKLPGHDPLAFARGEKMTLKNGDPVHVGPPVVASEAEASDFTVLQGSRIVMSAVDFDGDGFEDLVIGDTFADVRVFRGTQHGAIDAFEPGIVVTKLATRPEAVACADWDGDARPDLLIGGTAAVPCLLYKNSSRPGHPSVEDAQPIERVPYVFWGPKLQATDWNNDGDVDLLVQSEFFSFWLERSFLDRGYQMAKIQTQPGGSIIAEREASGEK